jgi:hypothetical protein|tara:strand:- start:8412 stop:8537 length:126 start_codon:yes stop_codon:yes gene_type:complete
VGFFANPLGLGAALALGAVFFLGAFFLGFFFAAGETKEERG